jgi:succinoglycan biosynthesis transport protein ExoP
MKYPYSSYNTPLPGYGTSLVDRINLYLHFRRYFKILAERWLLIVIFTLLGTGIAVFQAINKPDIFKAQSVLQVTPKVTVAGSRGAQIDEDSRMVENQLTAMQSGIVIAQVMARLQEGAGSSNKVVQPRFEALPGRGNTFIMEVKGTNLDLCQRFASAWVDEFIDYKKRQRVFLKSQAQAATTRDILALQRDKNAAQEDLEQFKRQNNIANFSDAGARARLQLEGARNAYFELQTRRKLWENATREELASRTIDPVLEGDSTKRRSDADSSLEDDAISSQAYQNLRFEIFKQEKLYEEKLATLRTNHPFMRELSRSIAQRKSEIGQVLAMVEEGRAAMIRQLRTKEESYPDLIKELEDQVFEKNSLELEYETRLKKRDGIIQQLDALENVLRSMNSIATEDEPFAVLVRGVGEPTPVEPNRTSMIISGVGLGFVIGLGLMFLLHKLDDRLDNPEHIEQELGEPILGQLPEVEKKHYKEGYLMLTRMKSHTMFAESLRGIRSALLLSPEGTSKRLLAVTSSVPGDGKTTFTTNFAITLANSGNRTLLIDADLRRGNVHGYFEQPLEEGLAEVLEGKLSLSGAIRETGVNNLFFMRAGARPSNPSELLIGPGTKDLIMALRRQFDYVIFDCPPLTAIDDTFSVAAFLDGLFFVVRAGKTSMRFAKMGINTIHQRGAPILGLIVNGVPIDNPYYYYTTYYYASYYHRPLSPDENAYPERRGVSAAPSAEQPVSGTKNPPDSN